MLATKLAKGCRVLEHCSSGPSTADQLMLLPRACSADDEQGFVGFLTDLDLAARLHDLQAEPDAGKNEALDTLYSRARLLLANLQVGAEPHQLAWQAAPWRLSGCMLNTWCCIAISSFSTKCACSRCSRAGWGASLCSDCGARPCSENTRPASKLHCLAAARCAVHAQLPPPPERSVGGRLQGPALQRDALSSGGLTGNATGCRA